MEQIRYVIKSTINNKYLSHLFEDTHEKIFQSSFPIPEFCYFWNNKEIAEKIAQKENGIVETFTRIKIA